MRIGITGTDGFIGGEVADALTQDEHQVVFLDGYTRNSSSGADFKELSGGLSWVLHFAASTSIEASFSDPVATYYNNLQSTMLALKIAQKEKSAFLFMSSYVYGQPKYLPIDERHPTGALNPYMGSKIMGEEVCRQLCRDIPLPLVILRASNIYGKRLIPGRLISDVLNQVYNGLPVKINDPLPKRDYLYIKDFIALIKKIISTKPALTGLFNVGSGQAYSNMEIAQTICQIAHSSYPVEAGSQPRSNDIAEVYFNVDLAKNTFSWSPEYSLKSGLSELVELNLQLKR